MIEHTTTACFFWEDQQRQKNELEPDDKAMVFRLIDTIVTKKKFKDFVATMQ